VREVAVIGRPHADRDEAVVAFVAARPDTTLEPSELDALCLAHIARLKRPRSYQLLDELPKNSYEKVPKTTLRDLPLSSDNDRSHTP
jgi:long-chain acyl-CoA synthetase